MASNKSSNASIFVLNVTNAPVSFAHRFPRSEPQAGTGSARRMENQNPVGRASWRAVPRSAFNFRVPRPLVRNPQSTIRIPQSKGAVPSATSAFRVPISAFK
jgi:hypothetical protein